MTPGEILTVIWGGIVPATVVLLLIGTALFTQSAASLHREKWGRK